MLKEPFNSEAATTLALRIVSVVFVSSLLKTYRSLLLQVVKQPIDKFSKPKIKQYEFRKELQLSIPRI